MAAARTEEALPAAARSTWAGVAWTKCTAAPSGSAASRREGEGAVAVGAASLFSCCAMREASLAWDGRTWADHAVAADVSPLEALASASTPARTEVSVSALSAAREEPSIGRYTWHLT